MRKILAIAAVVFMLSASSIMAQPGNMCEDDYNLDNNMDAQDVAKFLEDFGRSIFNNPCPEPPQDFPPMMTKYERMFCEISPECWDAGYEHTYNFPVVCCCWDMSLTYNYGCRGMMYCELDLMGMCM